MSLTIVMQGPITQWTTDFICRYKSSPCVSEVIFSTWSGQQMGIMDSNKVKVVYSQKPAIAGQGNRNYQIVSSQAGLKEARTKLALKVRSDLFLPQLELMLAFFHEHKKNENVFVLSMYPRFAFHPRDWVFFGETEHLKEVFDIPLDETTTPYNEWQDIRSETYIGMWYYRKYDNKIKYYINDKLNYMTDISLRRKEALAVYHRLMKEEKGFVPFPAVPIELPKHYPGGYPFDHLKNIYGEVYHGEF